MKTSALLLVTSTIGTSAGYATEATRFLQRSPVVPTACQNIETVDDFVQCLQAEGECLEENTMDNLKTCVETQAEAGDFSADQIVTACGDELLACEIPDVDDVPACVQETLKQITDCAIDNRESCATSCADTAIPDLPNTAPFQLATCRLIQTNAIDPICDTLSCCEPCQESFALVAECLVNEVSKAQRDCDFDCPADATRRLELSTPSSDAFSAKQGRDSTAILQRNLQRAECIDKVDRIAAGTDTLIDETTGNPDPFSTVLALNCVFSNFLGTLQDPTMVNDDEQDPTNGDSTSENGGVPAATSENDGDSGSSLHRFGLAFASVTAAASLLMLL